MRRCVRTATSVPRHVLCCYSRSIAYLVGVQRLGGVADPLLFSWSHWLTHVHEGGPPVSRLAGPPSICSMQLHERRNVRAGPVRGEIQIWRRAD